MSQLYHLLSPRDPRKAASTPWAATRRPPGATPGQGEETEWEEAEWGTAACLQPPTRRHSCGRSRDNQWA